MNKATPYIGVLQFPGTNCEYETLAAVKIAGMQGDIFRWNSDPDRLSDFDGYILPGGFSYQDRIRAGVVASRKPVIARLIKEAEKSKPILGICNGAQILMESGLVPGIERGSIEMALASNRTPDRRGYHCDWVYLRNEQDQNPGCFNLEFTRSQIIPMPVAHAEGRFATSDPAVIQTIQESGLIAFRYCSVKGDECNDFPINPNGAVLNIAGLYNKEKTILAFMPHPERAIFERQVPDDVLWNRRETVNRNPESEEHFPTGPGLAFFCSMKTFLQRGV